MYITHWLKPDESYRARQDGKLVKKTNLQFCKEVMAQIDKDKDVGAEIIENGRGEIAVKRFEKYPKPRIHHFVH
jgi:hypothetical protein